MTRRPLTSHFAVEKEKDSANSTGTIYDNEAESPSHIQA
jgi:hypothetical protein